MPRWRSIRLRNHDYQAHFVTICAHERRCLFRAYIASNPSRWTQDSLFAT